MTERRIIIRATGVVGGATLLSRIFGFIRDAVIAWFIGAGSGADAFFVAFRIPNLFRRLLAEGSLSAAFVPVFMESLTRKGREDAFWLARSAFRILVPSLATFSILGVIFSPFIVRVIAPGFSRIPETMNLAVDLTRIMFPYLFFVGLLALFMGILNALGFFAAPALAPVLLNLAMIGSVFLFSSRLLDPVTGLAVGVLIGGVLQLAFLIPVLGRQGISLTKKAISRHPGLQKIGKLMVPTALGAAVYQINVLVGTFLASLLPSGSVSYLYYADRLVQFPLGIFAIAAATAVLPSLSKESAAGDIQGVRDTFSDALRLVMFITFPSMVGLIVLREPIIAFLFERGAFDTRSTQLTAVALLYYGIGLWAFSAVKITVSAFYALQDSRTPMWTAVVSVGVNIGFGVLLMGPMGHGGLALAASVASMVNMGLLLRVLRTRLGSLKIRETIPSFIRSGAGSLVMGAGVWWIAFKGIPEQFRHGSGLFWGLMISLVSGFGLYVLFSLIFKSPELKFFISDKRVSISSEA